MFERDWTKCSNFGNHLRLNSWSTRLRKHKKLLKKKPTFQIDNEQDVYITFENYEGNGYGLGVGFAKHLMLITC